MPIGLIAEQEAAVLYERNIRLPDDVPAKIAAVSSVKKRRLKSAGAVIAWPNGESTTSKIACGKICSSYKAEMSALNMVLTEILDKPEAMQDESKIWIFTDSESAVKRLEAGPGAQTDSLADEVWAHLDALAERGAIRLQWIPGIKISRATKQQKR